MSRENDAFKSRIGVVMAIIGSAIGFGNFWRFPYLAGENGGGAFITIYILLSLCLGLPLIISEYIIGKTTHKDFIGAFLKLRPGSKWHFTGYLTLLTVILITSFYSVIGGWTINAIIDTISNLGVERDVAQIKEDFGGFINSGWEPILLTALFLGYSCIIVSKGVHSGVEKYNKILIPALFIVLIVMCIRSVMLPGFGKSLSFLFHPDFSKITLSTIISAFGQVFFSMSVGMGIYATYASYAKEKENVVHNQTIIALSDTFIAILAGIIIFSSVFSYGIDPCEGPQLVFIALPSLFGQMQFGGIFGLLFYVTLGIAALTSAISLVEVITTSMIDHFGFKRKKACIIILAVELTLGSICALSQVEGINISVLGYNFFDFLDMITANWMLTLACFLTSIFIGWRMERGMIQDIITCEGKANQWFYRPYMFILRYIAPIMMLILIANQTGLF